MIISYIIFHIKCICETLLNDMNDDDDDDNLLTWDYVKEILYQSHRAHR